MKEFFKMIKRGDLILISALILLSFLPASIFSYQQSENITSSSVNVAVISVNNKKVKEVVLTGHTGVETFDIYSSDHDSNTIEVRDDHIHMKSATCSDQICVRTRAISKPGQTIVCLPHKLIIEIITVDNLPENESIISS